MRWSYMGLLLLVARISDNFVVEFQNTEILNDFRVFLCKIKL